MENDLQHHGIKGQRWGVRRFQNSNGSLTPAGKKRYGYDDNKVNSSDVKRLKKAIKTANKDAKSLRKAGYTKEADTIDGVVKKNTVRLEKAKNYKGEQHNRVKKMSDQELRQKINRIKMENEYKNLTKETNKGKKAVQTFIAGASAIMTIRKAHQAFKTYKKFGDDIIEGVGDKLMSELNESFKTRPYL